MLAIQSEAQLDAFLAAHEGAEGLRDFIGRVSPDLLAAPHLDPIIDLFERSRHEEVRALVSMPPRHGKTTTFEHGLAWRTLLDPACLNFYAAFGEDLAVSTSRSTRRIARNAGVVLSKDSQSVYDWRTDYGGGLKATSVGGPITGRGCNGGIIVADDLVKGRAAAESKRERERVWDWLKADVLSRLEPGASMIVCNTRWHPDDVIGRLKEDGLGEDWEVVNLPAVSNEDGEPADEEREDNVRPLWPEKYPLAELKRYRKRGEYDWWSLYQGEPRPRGDRLFGEPSRFPLAGFSHTGSRGCIAVDPAASERTHADYSVAVTAFMKGYGDKAEMWIADVRRWQEAVPTVVKRLYEMQKVGKWAKGLPLVVEAAGAFIAIPQMLKQIEPKLRVKKLTPKGDKFTRAQPLVAAWNDGRVHVPQEAPWAQEFIDEIQAFTGVGDLHDDQVDAAAHAWAELVKRPDGRVKRYRV